jgi:hypothetical protein
MAHHPFDEARTQSDNKLRDRLAKVAPRITYVILCWDTGTTSDHPAARPDVILGPFTGAEAERVAQTLTCECEVTNITTDPPPWAL